VLVSLLIARVFFDTLLGRARAMRGLGHLDLFGTQAPSIALRLRSLRRQILLGANIEGVAHQIELKNALWRPDFVPVSYIAGDEAIGVHPFLRLRPPRMLAELEPEHILCGHGAGVHGPEATLALREALATSRRRLPGALLGGLRRKPKS